MELRHIRYFLSLAEELNFSRAAKRLYIAQPHLSRQIQELEEVIGTRLFYRTKRHVELTNAGKVFLSKAYEILDLVEQTRVTTRLYSTGAAGEFRVGFTGTIQDLIPTLKKYRELYPDVGIILKQMGTIEQIEALHDNKIDVALVPAPVNHDDIHVRPIKKMCLLAALPEEHPLALKQSLSIHDLQDETFIMTPKSAGAKYYETIMSVFKKAGFAPKITIQAHDLQTVLVLVAAGMGVTLTPSPINALNGVIHRKLDDVDLALVGSMAWRKDNRSEVLDKFLAFFFEYDHDKIEIVES